VSSFRSYPAAVRALLVPALVALTVASLSVAASPAGATYDHRYADAEEAAPPLPLEGEVVVIDPGHQLGAHNFPAKIARLVPAGGFRKPCQTTGTATNGGFPEATFNWKVALRLRSRLEALGATVQLTRHSNSERRWGPCVDVRGRAGNALPADLKISIHGDGSYLPGAHGFDVIAPTDRRPWTHDIFASSGVLARDVRAGLLGVGLPVANYVGHDGIDHRSDLATLNLSNIPTVLVELGNMRNASDARRMTSTDGRATYARGLVAGVRRFLG
jgi:N-acetylmuramoyl-L-alanine amidase